VIEAEAYAAGDSRGNWSAALRRAVRGSAERLGTLLPRGSDYDGAGRSWRRDVVAGITVAVVALPLALAFGITTGLGAQAGLVTAIVAGLIAGLFGGSNVQVSGPTGAMTVVLVPIVARHGVGAVYVVGIVAGVLLVAGSIAGIGRYLAYVPWPVVEGFTVGIAVIIFLQQVPAALGVPKPEGDNTAVVAAKALGDAFNDGNLRAIGIVTLVVVGMFAATRVHRSIPASLVGVAVATVVAEVADLDVARIGALPSSLPLPAWPSMSMTQVSELFSAAVAVALLAALESLLSAKVADGMADHGKHDPDRELFGQGLANLVVPLFGGMPSTGAIARTAVNVRAGARTRLSAIVHAGVLVVVVYLGGGLVRRIPLAALAGVLIFTAVRMVDVHNLRAVLRSTRSDALVLVVTATATIALDLVVAVEIGVAAAAVLALRTMSRAASAVAEPVTTAMPAMFERPALLSERVGDASVAAIGEVTAETEATLLSEHIITYRLDGALFFGAAQRFLAELTAVADVRVVILRLPTLQMLDATGAQALGEIVGELEGRGITVLLAGPRPNHLRLLEAVGALDRLAHENHLFGDLEAAIVHAHDHASRVSNHSPARVDAPRARRRRRRSSID
jgi:SulP family sulfate permease